MGFPIFGCGNPSLKLNPKQLELSFLSYSRQRGFHDLPEYGGFLLWLYGILVKLAELCDSKFSRLPYAKLGPRQIHMTLNPEP